MADSLLDRFYRAWFAPGLRILGYELRPYCLGHLLTLQALESPFTRLHEGVEIGAEDLLLALRVCADSRWPFRTVPADPGEHEAKMMARFVRKRRYLRLAVDRFLVWMLQCSQGPDLLTPEEGTEKGRPLGAPEALIYAVKLMPKLSERRVFTMPLSLVRFYTATVGEMDGTLAGMFMTPHLRGAMEYAEQLPDLSQMNDAEMRAHLAKEFGEKFAEEWARHRAITPTTGGLN